MLDDNSQIRLQSVSTLRDVGCGAEDQINGNITYKKFNYRV